MAVDLLLRGTLINVHTGQLEPDGAVAIDDGEIVALAEREADRTIEAEYVAPGLIDAHMHVESSMVTLPRYAEAVVPKGVTSVVHDPHEIANVLGEEGVRSVIEDASHTPLKARFTVPSSVPASPLQDNGATLGPDRVADLLGEEDVVALGEVMDIPGVESGREGIHEKIQAARDRGLTVDGHMPQVRGDTLQTVARYLDNDHESITQAEARAKADVGLRVYLREGSSSKNVADLAGIADAVDTRYLSLCTDDRDVIDIIEEGGVDTALRTAIENGVDPITAVQMGTINTAESYDLPFGRLRPGSPADLVLLSELETWDVEHVLIDGEVDPTAGEHEYPPTALSTDTVNAPSIDATDLALEAPVEAGDVDVRVIDSLGGLQTAKMESTVPAREGWLRANREADVLPIAVIERHSGDLDVGTAFVHGLGLERGAIGSTIAHDAHNLVVAGATYEAMATVANHLREIDGGIAAHDPETGTTSSLSLPAAGLIADRPLREVGEQFEAVDDAARTLGIEQAAGLMELAFLPLEVIPEYRITNNGLVDVTEMDYVDVIV
ncbi:MAG: adenine deaminase [Halodesulfurarchaeum sp.]